MRAVHLDRASGIPLYLQVATEIRYRIASGDLGAGELLPSLREAETAWGISLHTVRRAYRVLEREGLVETRERSGTRIADPLPLPGGRAEADRFLRSVLRSARERFGWDAERLRERLAALATEPESGQPVWVVECSDWLAGALAGQVREGWDVDARPWPLAEVTAVPNGAVVSTFYHHREVREATGAGCPEPAFLTIRLDPGYVERVEAAVDRGAGRIVLCGVEAETAGAMARDLAAVLHSQVEIEAVVSTRPSEIIDREPAGSIVVCSPENWDRLEEATRRRPNVLAHGSRFQEQALEALARDRGWPRANRESAGRGTVGSA